MYLCCAVWSHVELCYQVLGWVGFDVVVLVNEID